MDTVAFILLAITILVLVFFWIRLYSQSKDYERKLKELDDALMALDKSTLKFKITVKNEVSVSAGDHKDIINYKINKK